MAAATPIPVPIWISTGSRPGIAPITVPRQPVPRQPRRRWCPALMAGLLIAGLLATMAPMAKSAFGADKTYTLTVTVEGLKSAAGSVMVGLYDRAEGFVDTEPPHLTSVPAQVGSVETRFEGLPPGRYALTVFHDEDGNDEMNTNLLGIPAEPYGFSNDARGTFGPPSFEDAAIEITADAHISVTL